MKKIEKMPEWSRSMIQIRLTAMEVDSLAVLLHEHVLHGDCPYPHLKELATALCDMMPMSRVEFEEEQG